LQENIFQENKFKREQVASQQPKIKAILSRETSKTQIMEMTYFVAKRHKIAKRINRFLAQTKISRASTVSLIDLIDTQLLNFG
jgi:hypothetical protein